MEKILIEVSAKHVHLSREDSEILFGKDHDFKSRRELKCDNVFVTEDRLEIHHDGHVIKNVRIIMPFRPKTQVELAATDIFKLSKKSIFDGEGNQKHFDITLVGPKGRVLLRDIPVVALRHLHTTPEDAKRLGVHDGQFVKVLTEGPRSILFHNVKVRVQEGVVTTCHVDTDEGHAAGISREGHGYLVKE